MGRFALIGIIALILLRDVEIDDQISVAIWYLQVQFTTSIPDELCLDNITRVVATMD